MIDCKAINLKYGECASLLKFSKYTYKTHDCDGSLEFINVDLDGFRKFTVILASAVESRNVTVSNTDVI